MLAIRARFVCSIAVVALVGLGLVAMHWRTGDRPRREIDATAIRLPMTCAAAMVGDPDTLHVVLHEVPEVTGQTIESDWAKSFRMVWDGPIQTWTTMRMVRVPALDHRMIDSIEPSSETDVRVLRVRVRVVVPGDLEAALAWIRANPAVRTAEVGDAR